MEQDTQVINPIIASSVDATKVAATVEGIFAFVSGSTGLMLVQTFFPAVTANQLVAIGHEVGLVASLGFVFGGALWSLKGTLRKLLVRVTS